MCSSWEKVQFHGLASSNGWLLLARPCIPPLQAMYSAFEYMAASQSAKEAIWLRQLMADIGCVQERATMIMCDNQGCIALAKNPKHHSCTKHIDVQHHFIHEKVEEEMIKLRYCPTQEMVADVLTKGLARDKYEAMGRTMRLEIFDCIKVEV